MTGVQIAATSLCLFAGMMCFMEAGRRLGRWRAPKPGEPGPLFTALEGSLYGLMGLLVAFTFSAAAARYETRRQLIVQHTNAIETAWRRIELLPASRQPVARESLRRYVDSHLAVTRATNVKDARREVSRARALQREIWSESVSACREAYSPAVVGIVLPSLNSMFELTNTRMAAAQSHLPSLVLAQLIVLPLICSLFAGLNSASRPRRSWIHMLGFPAIVAITVFVILDLEYPRSGLIRLDNFDQALLELRSSMQGIL
jgi:hypothetical protein